MASGLILGTARPWFEPLSALLSFFSFTGIIYSAN